MKQKSLVIIILVLVLIISLAIIYQPINKKDTYDFTPSITQGIYGTALECHGSAEPPSTGEWVTVEIDFKIRNQETNAILEYSTNNDGTYEVKLEKGFYMIIVDLSDGEEIEYAEINIEDYSLIKKNIVTKFCPV